MNNEHLEELAALQAVGLLDDTDLTELLQATDRDPDVDRVVREYAETAALLAWEAPQVKPPPELKQTILCQLPTRRKDSKLIFLSTLAPYAIAACLAIVAVEQARQILAVKSQLETESAQLTDLTHFNQRDVLAGLKLTALEPKDISYLSTKIVVAWDPVQHKGLVSMQNLPAPTPGHNYQLWVLDPHATAPISAGLIHPGAGSGSFTVKPLSIDSPGFAITLEPGEGSPVPTGSILFAVAPVE